MRKTNVEESSSEASVDIEESSREASVDIENQLAKSMRNHLENLPDLPSACCIYRVPVRLRQQNIKAYTPQVVSIGPLHHGSKNLSAMEGHKCRYLNCFLRRIKEENLEKCFKKIKEREVALRNYYEDIGKLDDFASVILVDAAFVIELLLRYSEGELQDDNVWIFKKSWMLQNILPDMLMLENQLPFFILEDLYNFTGAQTGERSIIELSYRFFQQALRLENWEKMKNLPALHKSFMSCDSKIPLHFVDFIRTLHLPDLSDSTPEENVGLQSTPSMTKLHQAGVKFNVGSSKNLFDIQFKKNTLEIPKDVELLVENKIVVNTLGDNNKVSIMINKLCSKVAPNHENYYFGTLADGLNKYYEKTSNRWKAYLRQKYFNTPWALISLFAAVILLILTVIQTVCSIISVIDQGHIHILLIAVGLSVAFFSLSNFLIFVFCFVIKYVKEWIRARFMLVCCIRRL